jgi:hypothetical protein
MSVRTYEQQLPPALPRRDPSGLLRQPPLLPPQPITAHISYMPTRIPIRSFPTSASSNNLNNNHHPSNINNLLKRASRSSAHLEDTIPQFQALQIAKPIHSYSKEYENYFYI